MNGEWHNWKSMQHDVPRDGNSAETVNCCIQQPHYYVEIGRAGSTREIIIKPVPNATYVERYYVVVDEREESDGNIERTMLTDKLTAQWVGIPYYVAASFDNTTLINERTFPVGDGKVYGGFINYPLEKDKHYTFPFVTKWRMGNTPILGWWRGAFFRYGRTRQKNEL